MSLSNLASSLILFILETVDEEPLHGYATANSHLFIYLFIYLFLCRFIVHVL